MTLACGIVIPICGIMMTRVPNNVRAAPHVPHIQMPGMDEYHQITVRCAQIPNARNVMDFIPEQTVFNVFLTNGEPTGNGPVIAHEKMTRYTVSQDMLVKGVILHALNDMIQLITRIVQNETGLLIIFITSRMV